MLLSEQTIHELLIKISSVQIWCLSIFWPILSTTSALDIRMYVCTVRMSLNISYKFLLVK